MLNGSANLLLKNPDDFFSRLLLEVGKRECKDIQQVNEAGQLGWSGQEQGVGVTGITKMLDPRSELMW